MTGSGKQQIRGFRGLRGRMGLLGGSFDPVHRAHVAIARSAQAAHGLERIVFLPAASSPHKPRGTRAPAEHRLAMVELALASEPGLYVSALELEREGPSYTVDTLELIRGEVGSEAELYFIVGSDCLPELPRWRNVVRIFELAEIVAVERTGFGRDDLESLRGRLPPPMLDRLRRAFVARDPIEVSSSELRETLATGRPADADLHPDVLRYIREHRLYEERSE